MNDQVLELIEDNKKAINVEKIKKDEIAQISSTYNIIGQDEAKEELEKILTVMAVEDIGQYLVLLEGPPGTGKSTIIRNILTEFQKQYPKIFHYKYADASTLTRHVTTTAETINAFFDDIEKKKGKKIIFIDEIDEVCSSRKDAGHIKYERTAALIRNLNREIPNLVIIGASNRPKMIDGAILSRFMFRINCGLPTENEMYLIIEMYLGKYLDEEKIQIFHKYIKSSSYKWWNGRDIWQFSEKLKLELALRRAKKQSPHIENEVIAKLFYLAEHGKNSRKNDYLDEENDDE